MMRKLMQFVPTVVKGLIYHPLTYFRALAVKMFTVIFCLLNNISIVQENQVISGIQRSTLFTRLVYLN